MTVFLVFSRRTTLAAGLVIIIVAAGALSALILPGRLQPQPLRVGISSPFSSLAAEMLPGWDDIDIIPSPHPSQLKSLDYYIATDGLVAGWETHEAGEVVATVVVNFFNPLSGITLDQLEQLLADSPGRVLISRQLALPAFPWHGSHCQYLPTALVLEQVAADSDLVGIVPLHHRIPSVRVLPLDGLDPRTKETALADYPLRCPLVVQKTPPSLGQRLARRFRPAGDPLLDHLVSPANPYSDLWQQQASFAAVGDVMLDRDVKKEGRSRGWEWIFSEVAPLLNSMDLAFANLECPVGQRGHLINMFQAPPEAMAGITSAGFDVVSLANNHILDYHFEGMFETMELLAQHGIAAVGAGQDIDAAREPVILEINGIRVGFLAYTEMWFVHAQETISWQATEDEPGVAPARLEYIVEDVGALREQADVVVVSFHWGKEYTHQPTPDQIRLGRAAVDAGAHLVLGHHPHVLQGIEFYQQGVIAYSLGNFVFDLYLPKTCETMVLEFTLSPRGVLDMTIHPAYICGVQPRLLEGTAAANLYAKLRSFSLGLVDN